MASEINQVLPLALSQIVNQSHNLGLDSKANPQQLANPKDIAHLTQLAAAQTVSKVKSNDKNRGTQVPKRSEPDFASNDENYKEDDKTELEKTEKKKSLRDLNLVA